MNPTEPRRLPRATTFPLILLLWTLTAGCDRPDSAPPPARQKSPTVASLVPAATDLIVGMGAGDHLVAVSNYDRVADVATLPRVGDYQSIDWEKLAILRPNVLISFYGSGHTPAGFLEKINDLKIQQVNVRLDRLDEIYAGIETLGKATGEPAKAAQQLTAMRAGIESVRSRVHGRPKVSALIVLSPTGADVVGRQTFFDDLLTAAGGENVITADRYVTLDREALSALRPDVILQLLPGRDAQTIAHARAAWDSMPTLPAVRNKRVHIFTEDYVMQPGPHLAEVAERFAAALHPDWATAAPAATAPTTRGAP